MVGQGPSVVLDLIFSKTPDMRQPHVHAVWPGLGVINDRMKMLLPVFRQAVY
jgi:hypothetical protein